jgi:hypothetical protein
MPHNWKVLTAECCVLELTTSDAAAVGITGHPSQPQIAALKPYDAHRNQTQRVVQQRCYSAHGTLVKRVQPFSTNVCRIE